MGGSASTHWSSNGYYHSPPFAARRRLDAGPLPSSSSTTGGGGGPAGQLASSSRASHGFLGGIRDRLRQAARHNYLASGPSSSGGGNHHRRQHGRGHLYRADEVKSRTAGRKENGGSSGGTVVVGELEFGPEVQGALAFMRKMEAEEKAAPAPSSPPVSGARARPEFRPNITIPSTAPAPGSGSGAGFGVSSSASYHRQTAAMAQKGGGNGSWNGNGRSNGDGRTNGGHAHDLQHEEAGLYPLERVPHHTNTAKGRAEWGPPSFHGPGPTYPAYAEGNGSSKSYVVTTPSGSGTGSGSGLRTGSGSGSGDISSWEESPGSHSHYRDVKYRDAATQTDASMLGLVPGSVPPDAEAEIYKLSYWPKSAGAALGLDGSGVAASPGAVSGRGIGGIPKVGIPEVGIGAKKLEHL